MIITVDEAISYAGDAFSKFGEVKLLHGRQITNSILKNSDVLITRSITDVNKILLNDTKVKFVGTATIGMDHIDMDYLQKRGIAFASAAGCNAFAVTEYVFTSIFELLVKYNYKIEDVTIGIIGYGNIGSKVLRFAEAAGFKVLVNDPPLKRKTGSSRFVELDEVLNADIITLHVPLNAGGIDNTIHLLNENNLKQIKDGAVIINAARGAVIDNKALLSLMDKKNFKVVLDVWENEPYLNLQLLEKVEFGSPHVAGYSYEGKVNGTKMMFDAVKNFISSSEVWEPELPRVKDDLIRVNTVSTHEKTLRQILSFIYNPYSDYDKLKQIASLKLEEQPVYFERLRKEYSFRREFTNYKIKLTQDDYKLKKLLTEFRFNVL